MNEQYWNSCKRLPNFVNVAALNVVLVLKLLTPYRTLVKSAYQKINFLISQSKHMLWVLKRTSQ